jgi:hypothetical protein
VVPVIAENRYIATTLYGDDDEEEDTPQQNTMIEEPRLLGFNSSNEKVCLTSGLLYVLMNWCNLTCLNC